MQHQGVVQRVVQMEETCQGLQRSQQETERNIQKTTVSIEELRELFKETDRMGKETDRRMRETDRLMKETDRQIKETGLQMKETDRQMKETDRQMKETGLQMKETDQRLNELGKHIGGLGEKFGSFTEGMAFPAMTRILQERFGMQVVAPHIRVRKNGRHLEPDLLAYSHTGKTAGKVFVVEIKSQLREEGIQQMLRMLDEFFDFFPDFRSKELYGILAAVQIPEGLRERVLGQGLYLAQVGDEVFEIQVPEGFQPRVFRARSEGIAQSRKAERTQSENRIAGESRSF